MNALREKAKEGKWSEDQFAAILPFEGRFIVLSWYKQRGRTEGAWLLDQDVIVPLTLHDAVSFLEAP